MFPVRVYRGLTFINEDFYLSLELHSEIHNTQAPSRLALATSVPDRNPDSN